MHGSGRWFQGGCAALIGIIALVCAGSVAEGRFLFGGLLIFIAALAYVGFLIRDYWDEKDNNHVEYR